MLYRTECRAHEPFYSMQRVCNLILIGILVYSPSPIVFGMGESTPAYFTNENWETVLHPRVLSFTVLNDGSSYGVTETGIPFRQYPISSPYGMRIQRFEIQEHYHYIVDGKVVNSLTELSLLLAQAFAHEGIETT